MQFSVRKIAPFCMLSSMRLLPIIFFTLFFVTTSAAENEELIRIDEELELLNKELHTLQHEAFNAEMQGQIYMLDDWSDYAKKLAQAEKEEHAIKTVKKRIEELQVQKQALLKK